MRKIFAELKKKVQLERRMFREVLAETPFKLMDLEIRVIPNQDFTAPFKSLRLRSACHNHHKRVKILLVIMLISFK